MAEHFNPANEVIDFNWAIENGWEINGILAYRHILFENRRSNILKTNPERIEQILMMYEIKDFVGQTQKIKEALQELIELKRIFSQLMECEE